MTNNQKPQKILVSVAWPYVNGNIHVGHLAGYLLPADIFARYHRLRGDDVLMVSGSDCHGTPITVQADKEKKTPQEVVEVYHERDLELFDLYDLSYNLYTKTTTQNHKEVVHGLFLELLQGGFIIKDTMKQYYSASEQKFLPDRYVEGTCPHCHAEEQRSDQCENCGRWLKDGELINPISKLSKEKVELKDTEHYFLDFEKLQKDLEDFLHGKGKGLGQDKKEIWRDWVYKETQGWLKEGMQKRAITRDLDWSIELPEKEIRKLADEGKIPADQVLSNFKGKRIYVWFEAVTGYLSAPQEWEELAKTKAQEDFYYDKTSEYLLRHYKNQGTDWTEWWENPESRHFYFMGQDNLVFHTLMWPGQLIGANTQRKEEEKYTLPYNVVVNKFLNFNEAKFSKSRGNIIDSREIAEKFGTDAVRYFIIANLPENKETNFTWERFIDANNNEFVANLGNFINRTLVLFQRNRGIFAQIGESIKLDIEVQGNIDESFRSLSEHFEKCEFVSGLDEVMKLSSFGNKYLNDKKLWELVGDQGNTDQAKQVMLDLLNIVEALRILMRPFFPEAYKNLTEMLGLEYKEPEVGVDQFEFSPVQGYPNLQEVKPLFRKIDKEKVLTELNK